VIQKSIGYISKMYVLAPGCWDFAKEMYCVPDNKLEYLYLGADVDRIMYNKISRISLRIREKMNLKCDDFVFITGGETK
jgi:1,2-diacylglycerol 3-alpha-glucosyltransferase